jgi:hypothetical protein
VPVTGGEPPLRGVKRSSWGEKVLLVWYPLGQGYEWGKEHWHYLLVHDDE